MSPGDPIVTTQMLIRKPVSEVFRAFVDPEITTRFWFTHGSGKLEPGAEVVWRFEMYGLSIPVVVRTLEADRRIRIDWGDPPSPVEWRFERRPHGTLVTISTWGFTGDEKEIVAKALDAMGGFSFVLAGAKAWLEHGVALNLSADHHPDQHVGG